MAEQESLEAELERALSPLLRLVRRLRGPNGCPWDREQTLDDCRAHLLEEAHEVAAAIDSEDAQQLGEELGDLLFQVVFLAELAREEGLFELPATVDATVEKMVERHPHVFGEQQLHTAADVERAWQRRKLEDRQQRQHETSLLSGVPESLPALTAAYRLAQKAAGVGFDWEHEREIVQKLSEELEELEEAMAQHASAATDRAIEEELGDLLFAAACLGRRLGVDPERALARANRKFRQRFEHVERTLGPELARAASDPEIRARMERLWEEAKQARKA